MRKKGKRMQLSEGDDDGELKRQKQKEKDMKRGKTKRKEDKRFEINGY